MGARRSPGVVRDAIIDYLRSLNGDASVEEIHAAVEQSLGCEIAPSSVRSYLGLNEGHHFVRTSRGRYRIKSR